MTVQNDFLAFGIGGGANVASQSTYAASAILNTGNQSGVASSSINNKALRQGSIGTALLAKYIVQQTGLPVIDNGDMTTLLANFTTAIASSELIPPMEISYPSGSHTSEILFDLVTGAPLDSDGRAGAQAWRMIVTNGVFTNGPVGDVNYTDNVFGVGWNLSQTFTRLDLTKPAASIRIENMFTQGSGTPFGAEFHLATIQTIQGTEHRMIEAFAPHNDGDHLSASLSFAADVIGLNNYAGTSYAFIQFSGTTPVWQWAQPVVQQMLTNNVPWLTQVNAAGNSTVALPFIDDLGNMVVSAPITTLQSGGVANGPTLTARGAGATAFHAICPGATSALFALTCGTGGSAKTANYIADNTGALTIQSSLGATMIFGHGVTLGAATDMGSGTINVSTGIYLNGSAYTFPDFVFEHFFTGAVEKFSGSPGAKNYRGLLPLAQLEAHVRENWRLPGITDAPADIFERSDVALRFLEEHSLYLIGHEKRIAEIERRLAAATRG